MFLLTIKIEDWESGVSQFKKSVLTRIQESAPDDENPFKKYEFLEQFLCSIQANMLDQKVDETFVAGLTNLSKVDIASCQKAAALYAQIVKKNWSLSAANAEASEKIKFLQPLNKEVEWFEPVLQVMAQGLKNEGYEKVVYRLLVVAFLGVICIVIVAGSPAFGGETTR
ncbi:hypothetical protein ScalyP_jg9081 [Parmales sp. scaly parma]|nr:hypothetical protein ScalyP_jg9081 [Parmales sp. scaly parma]